MTSIPSEALLGGRLVLSAVFLIAGSAKLGHTTETTDAAVELGLPRRWASAAAPALPAVEIALAAGLAATPTARPSAIAAAALLTAFTTLAARSLHAGRRPRCRCFGTLSLFAGDRTTVARDAVLALLALVIASAGPGAATPVSGPAASALLLLAALCVTAPIIAGTRTDVTTLRATLDAVSTRLATLESVARLSYDGATPIGGPEAGAPPPTLHLTTPDGAPHQLQPRPDHDRDLLLLFLEPDCDPCERLLTEAPAWQRDAAPRLTLFFIYGETPDAAAHAASAHGLTNLYAQPDRRASEDYRIPGSPSATLIGPDGLVKIPLVPGFGAVRELVERYLPARV